MTAISSLPASANRVAELPSPPPHAQAHGRAPLLGGGRAPVALSDLGIKLSNQAAQRSEQVGKRTVDLAQDFINDFTRRYLGDGASVAFESASIDTSSSLSASRSHLENADGVQDAAAFSLNESAHFIGKGSITTADGQSFEFEIEVQYELTVEASSSRSVQFARPDDASAPAPEDTNGHGNRLVRALPPFDFGGELADLFKLLGRELKTDLAPSKEGGNDGGSLTLRLLKLITDSQAAPATPPAQETLNKAVADIYATA
jgi:hypothetical protein